VVTKLETDITEARVKDYVYIMYSIDSILVDSVADPTLLSPKRGSSKAVKVPKLISMAIIISSEKADQTH
jgi:hypothetical protein